MDAVKFIKERKRMCNGLPCATCPLFAVHQLEYLPACKEWCMDHPEASVTVVEKWAEEHPRKTLLSELLKRWPAVRLDERGVLSILPCLMNPIQYRTPEDTCATGMMCMDCRKKYWMQEVE